MATLNLPLYIAGGGAVTPAGLNARQTIASIRSCLSAYDKIYLADPLGQEQIAARIPTHLELRQTPGSWLVNMAARAIIEALNQSGQPAQSTAILMTCPEVFRHHPGLDEIGPAAFLSAVITKTGQPFHASSRMVDGGAAASIGLITQAGSLLNQGLSQVLVGGCDSLLSDSDLSRLFKAGRLKGDENAQGLVPGEGAVFVCLRRAPAKAGTPSAAIHGVGLDMETDSALTERYSQGHAMLRALQHSVAGPGQVPAISFVISNGNGERYSAWEALITRTRFYRVRREILPVAFPAMTVGEIGAASGALALLVAADSFDKGYAPGPVAMCEIASEGGLRAAALVSRTNIR